MMISFFIYLILSTVLFLIHQKPRKHGWIPMILIALIGFHLTAYLNQVISDSALRNLFTYSTALTTMILFCRISFEMSWSDALFCAIGGYTVQFMASILGEMSSRLLSFSYPFHEVFRLLAALIILPAAYFLFCRKLKKGQNVDLNRLALLALLAVAVLIEIVLCHSLRQVWTVVQDNSLIASDCILLFICSLVLLNLQFSLLLQEDLKNELDILQQMMRKEQNQYQLSKETIDTINRKCHDMRHQIRTIGQSVQIDPQALAEMENSIGIYDALYQTGSKALDIILAEKALLCQNNGIVISCMADGAKLDFISDTDIYSLFGNLLENAIHAVQDLEPEQRIIGLNVKTRGSLLSIHSHNCFVGEVAFENSLPVTSSTDTMNRGFGVKSIAMIVRKYGGTVTFQAKDGLFSLNILIPMEQ